MKKIGFVKTSKIYKTGMYRYAYSILKNDDDSQDAIQETIYKAYRNLDGLRDEKNFKSWIYKILTNSSLEIINKRKTYLDIDSDVEIADKDKNIETNLSLWEAVQSLKQPYRDTIILYYYNDLSIKEICDIKKSTKEAIKKQLLRGREKIKNKMGGSI